MPTPSTHTALLVIDVQQGLFGKSTPIYKADALIGNINALIDRAEKSGAPVVFVQHSDKRDLAMGSAGWHLHAGLHHPASECGIHKLHGNAFEETSLDEDLKSRGVDRVVVAGLVTHGCVKATCQGAKALGYAVTLASDGHSSYSKDAARLIGEWNDKLGAQAVEVTPAADIMFG